MPRPASTTIALTTAGGIVGGLLLACGAASEQSGGADCTVHAGIEVCDFWVRSVPPSIDTTAGYLTLRAGETGDLLVGARSPDFAAVEIHESSVRDGLVQMIPRSPVQIDAESEVRFAPGGLHLMMIGAARALPEEEPVRLALEFERAGTIEVSGAVRASARLDPSGG